MQDGQQQQQQWSFKLKTESPISSSSRLCRWRCLATHLKSSTESQQGQQEQQKRRKRGEICWWSWCTSVTSWIRDSICRLTGGQRDDWSSVAAETDGIILMSNICTDSSNLISNICACSSNLISIFAGSSNHFDWFHFCTCRFDVQLLLEDPTVLWSLSSSSSDGESPQAVASTPAASVREAIDNEETTEDALNTERYRVSLYI